MERLVRDIKTVEEAFSYLSERMQNHSKRVSEYTLIIFTQVVADDIYSDTGAGRRELIPENRPLAAQAGLYHDIGKAYLPAAYQMRQPVMSTEELAVYKKHVTDGEALLPTILKDFEKRKVLEKRMVLSGILEHHERVDGEGFPQQKVNKEISYIGKMVAIANALDNLSMETVSEEPFEEAIKAMQADVGTLYDEEIFKATCSCKGKLKRVFQANSAGSREIPSVDLFVKRKVSRPMELIYRPIWGNKKKFLGLEASMQFAIGGEAGSEIDEVKHIISKQGIAYDLCHYFIYEACDAIRRFKAYNIPVPEITVPLLPVFWNKKSMLKGILQILEEEEIKPYQIRLSMTADMLEKPTKGMKTNLEDCIEMGMNTVVTSVDYGVLSPAQIAEAGIFCVSMKPDFEEHIELPQAKAWLEQALSLDLELQGDGIAKLKYCQTLESLGFTRFTGMMIGDYEKESTILERAIQLRSKK